MAGKDVNISQKQLALRVLSYVIPHWSSALLIFVLILGSSYVDVSMPRLYRAIVDEALPKNNVEELQILTMKMMVAVLASSILKITQGWISTSMGEQIASTLRLQLFSHLQQMPMDFFVKNKKGEFNMLFTTELGTAKNIVGRMLPKVISSTVILIMTLYQLISLQWKLSFLAIVMVLIFQLPFIYVRRKMVFWRRKGMSARAEMSNSLRDSLSTEGWLLFRSFGKRNDAEESFCSLNESVGKTNVKLETLKSTFEQGLYLFVAFVGAGVFYVGGSSVMGSFATSGDVVAFSAHIGRLFGPISAIAHLQLRFVSGAACFSKVFSYIDMKSWIVDRKDAVLIDEKSWKAEVAFDHVSFHYDEHLVVPNASKNVEMVPIAQNVLNDVSFSLPSPGITALVGENGCGKSTVCHLIARFYDATEGTVMLGGQDVRSIKLRSLSELVMVLSGTGHMLHDSILNNLRYGSKNASTEEIEAACAMVEMHDFIMSLPDGYNTIVGEHSFRLSGGEAQRLCIARSVLTRPPILILDEAFSQIDSVVESRIMKHLQPFFKERLTVVVAHRLTCISGAQPNMVIVLGENGQIVEKSETLESLMQNHDSYFHALFHTQLSM